MPPPMTPAPSTPIVFTPSPLSTLRVGPLGPRSARSSAAARSGARVALGSCGLDLSRADRRVHVPAAPRGQLPESGTECDDLVGQQRLRAVAPRLGRRG